MGLSEHEQRVLDELERGLYADDENLARRLKKVADETPVRQSQRSAARRIAGSAIALGGLGVILVGAIVHYAWMGWAGFVATLAGLVLATSPSTKDSTKLPGSKGGPSSSPRPKGSKPSASLGGIADFFEDRWNRRANGQ